MTKKQVINFIKNFRFIEVPHLSEYEHPEAIIQDKLKMMMIHELGGTKKDIGDLMENLRKYEAKL